MCLCVSVCTSLFGIKILFCFGFAFVYFIFRLFFCSVFFFVVVVVVVCCLFVACLFFNLMLVCCLLIVFAVCVMCVCLFFLFTVCLFVCLFVCFLFFVFFYIYLLTVLALPMLAGARASGVRAARACALWESCCAGRALSAHTRIDMLAPPCWLVLVLTAHSC